MPEIEEGTVGERVAVLRQRVDNLERDFEKFETKVMDALERIESQLHRQKGFIGAFMLIGSVLGAMALVLQGWVSKKLGLA